jgi:hypothetical protein
VRTIGCLVFLILTCPLSGYSQISGTVSDPSGLAIAGAEVVLTCSEDTAVAITDVRGRFRYDRQAGGSDCSIAVSQSGFERFQQGVRFDERAVVEVRLKIATVRQAVRVEERREDPLVRTTISSISLSDADLAKISADTGELIRYAKLLAGAMARDDIIHVDGLPSSTLPPAEMISRIVVNANPFSAQYAEGNANFVDIVTKPPDRKLRFGFGGSPPGAGARDAIMPAIRSDSQAFNFRMRGPVFRLPLTFSLRGSFANNVNNNPVVAAVPAGLETSSEGLVRKVRSLNQSGSGAFDGYYSREALQASISYTESRTHGSNQGAGGLTLAESGFDTSSIVRSTRVNVSHNGPRILVRSGLIVGQRVFDMRAITETRGVSVAGAFVAGGSAVKKSASERMDWNWTTVIQTNDARPWMVGLPIARTMNRDEKVPNRAGTLYFENLQAYTDALSGARTGTWLLTSGKGNIRHAMLSSAPFVQGTLKRSERSLVSGGVRLEYQSGFGTQISPRLTFATERNGLVLRAGAGLFIRNVADNVFMRVLSSGPGYLRQFVTQNVSLLDALNAPTTTVPTVHSVLASDLSRTRELMIKTSIERPTGKWTPAMEYTWTRDRHLLGSRRTRADDTWRDILESNSSAERHELHVRFTHSWKRHMLVGHYNWIHARDDGDGPFSFPEAQDNRGAEWARTAGVAPHNVTIVGNVSLPAAIALALTYAYRNSAPYNITTGFDSSRMALYNDRGGRPRNAGDGPGQNSLSLYFSRRLALPGSQGRVHMNLGVQADNVLAARNYVGVGSVAGSPMYGKPIAAYPGPSLRLWFNVD